MSVEIGESTQVGAKEWTATHSNGGLVCGTAAANWESGPGWKSLGYVSDDSSIDFSPYIIGAEPTRTVIPDRIPDSLCGNCRRDRHDYPLTETVAEMWKSLSFDEDYDPASDVSRIVCPGSDVCGPVAAARPHSDPWVTCHKEWLDKIMTWPEPYLPVKWDLSTGKNGWTLADINELKDSWNYKPEAKGFSSLDYLAFDEPLSITAYTWLPGDTIPSDLYAFAPVDQAAIEAAPKQIEHEAPQSSGFDFSTVKTEYPTYPTGKKKKK